MERILAGHELCCAETMSDADRLLREQSFDLIVCTIAFDESSMFELLQLAKSVPDWERIPFVGARVRAHILRSPAALESVALTCRTLGAQAFLDIAAFAGDNPEVEMREAMERFLVA